MDLQHCFLVKPLNGLQFYTFWFLKASCYIQTYELSTMLWKAQGTWRVPAGGMPWERERPSGLQTYEWIRYLETAACSLSCSNGPRVEHMWAQKQSPSQIPDSLTYEQNKMGTFDFCVVCFAAIENQNKGKELKLL